ncbi:MAG TPA: acyl-ACP--UDP-N-acetylglucosamine O-acyltransferase [Chthoniobacterales bacterium]|nr:acyl-ACP--UDP-N-acetylglucosamine O-acyltransferase [Chthoniobacterales bacterium]
MQHPMAIIDPAAQLGQGVQVGPYSIIGPEVVIGDGTVVQSHVVLEGRVRIGEGNLIGHGCVIGAPPQDLSFRREANSRVEIGARNVIREHCTIHRGTTEGSATLIGEDNFLMAGVHVGHNCRIGNGVIIANSCLLAGYVQIDDRAFIGGGTTFHQFMRVGRLVMAQGSSAFGKDIPPFLLAAERNYVFGVNVLGLRRAGFGAAERDEVRRAFKLLYRSGLNVRQALAKAAETEFGPLAREFFEFVAAAGKRGILPYKARAEE